MPVYGTRDRGLVATAAAFGCAAHADKFRPNGAHSPYSEHIGEVAALVDMAGGSEAQIAAGWLHDTVEDVEAVTLEGIEARFGAEVALLVDGLTDPPDYAAMPLLPRKTLQAERLHAKGDAVKLVKLADQISNVRSVAVDPPVDWTAQKSRDYVEGARRIAEACLGVSPLLDRLFAEAHAAAVAAHPLPDDPLAMEPALGGPACR